MVCATIILLCFKSEFGYSQAWTTTMASVMAPVCALLAIVVKGLQQRRASHLWADMEAPLALAMAGVLQYE